MHRHDASPGPAPAMARARTAALAASLLAAAALAAMAATPALARDTIRIVGSSTVFPFTQAVAEEYASLTGAPAPVVESTGTGGGFKLFCAGLGLETPDIAGASRAVKDSEVKLCAENGVGSVSEVFIGYDGLSLAASRQGAPLSLTLEQIFLALAAEVPVNGAIVPNPHKRWSEIDPALPATEITVFGPPPTSGTRDAFVELAMEAGCEALPEIAALEKERREAVCARMRSDGPFIEAGENDNLIVQRLVADPEAVGIFGFSFLQENQDALQGVAVGGISPSFKTVQNRSYPLVRPLFFYVKNDHRGVVPGLEEFIGVYVDESAIGAEGFLRARGLVPLGAGEREQTRQTALQALPLR